MARSAGLRHRGADQHAIHFRCAEPSTANPDKYADELLDAYLFVEDADALHAEYAANGVELTRGLANMPWHSRGFVVKDCDGLRPEFEESPCANNFEYATGFPLSSR